MRPKAEALGYLEERYGYWADGGRLRVVGDRARLGGARRGFVTELVHWRDTDCVLWT